LTRASISRLQSWPRTTTAIIVISLILNPDHLKGFKRHWVAILCFLRITVKLTSCDIFPVSHTCDRGKLHRNNRTFDDGACLSS
ncbi:hypothetical protein LSH36_44g04048, partial [Paralvinella palmiformis]